MAVYSFFGFGGALIGPIMFGALLDAGGGASVRRAWILAFAGLAAVGPCRRRRPHESRSATFGSTRISGRPRGRRRLARTPPIGPAASEIAPP
jgi:MFS family permease